MQKNYMLLLIFYPSSVKGYEMFPNAIIEAMTYGNAFVATDTQGEFQKPLKMVKE